MPEAERSLPRFYDARFGRRRYVVPVLLLVLLAIIPIDWAIESALAWSGHPGTAVRLPPQAVAAIAGAYTWVAADVLSRWQYRDLLPIHVTWAALRFAVALPLAYAFGSLVAADLKIFVAFAISAFPTRALVTITRRIFRRKLDLGDAGEKAESELEKLQGIDTRVAERFADEGYTTVLQLAYADPIELTMRCSSFGFSFVTDCASQALAWIYLEDRLATLRVMSIHVRFKREHPIPESARFVVFLDAQEGGCELVLRREADEEDAVCDLGLGHGHCGAAAVHRKAATCKCSRTKGDGHMLKYTLALTLAGTASLGLNQAQNSSCPSDVQRVRVAVQFARAVNTGESRFRTSNQRYGQISEIGVGSAPDGFRTQLATDGATYLFSIKDTIDACHFALFSDEQGLIYTAQPLR